MARRVSDFDFADRILGEWADWNRRIIEKGLGHTRRTAIGRAMSEATGIDQSGYFSSRIPGDVGCPSIVRQADAAIASMPVRLRAVVVAHYLWTAQEVRHEAAKMLREKIEPLRIQEEDLEARIARIDRKRQKSDGDKSARGETAAELKKVASDRRKIEQRAAAIEGKTTGSVGDALRAIAAGISDRQYEHRVRDVRLWVQAVLQTARVA